MCLCIGYAKLPLGIIATTTDLLPVRCNIRLIKSFQVILNIWAGGETNVYSQDFLYLNMKR
jgi:hypothetical protein